MPRQINSEIDAAAAALLIATEKANASMMAFSGWLVGGVGGTIALLFSNLEKLNQMVQSEFLKASLALLLVALLLSTITRLMSSMVSAALESNEKSLQLADEIRATGKNFNVDLFTSEFLRGLFPLQRWFANKSMNKAKQGDAAAAARALAKISQAQAMLVLIEVGIVVISGALLIIGMRT